MGDNIPRYSPTEMLGINAVERVFLNIGWIKRNQHESDMGIDLHVEECIEGNPTGRLVALQVKSGVSWWHEVYDNSIVFRFDQTHYDYWLNHSLPVLVALYHPNNKKVIWQHITPERCQKAGSRWKIYIPLDHEFNEHSICELSTIAAKPSLQLAVMREEKYYEQMDPRFKVRVSVLNGKPLYEFNPKEDVRFQMTISSDSEDICNKISRFQKGYPVIFDKGEISFNGSPLFESVKKEQYSGIEIQFAGKKQVDVSLVTLDNNLNERARFDFPSALITTGITHFSINTNLKNSPLNISMESSTNFKNKERKVSFTFNPEIWFGKSLINLPYFEKIHQLFESIMNCDSLRLDCSYEGNPFSSSVSEKIGNQINNWHGLISLLWKARFIANKLQVNPKLIELSDKQIREVEILYDLVRNGEVTIDAPRIKFESTVRLSVNLREHPAMNNLEKPAELCIESMESQCMPFLGNSVEVGPMRITATSVRLTNRDEVERELKDGSSEEVKFVFEGTDTCKVIRQIKKRGDTP